MTLTLSAHALKSEARSKLQEISGVNLSACYQCGNCSAGCPCVEAMEIPPQRVMRLAQFGQIDALLQANTMWVCAACLTCSARCPKGIDIAAVMEGLRHLVLRDRDHANYVTPDELAARQIETLPPIALINNFRKLSL